MIFTNIATSHVSLCNLQRYWLTEKFLGPWVPGLQTNQHSGLFVGPKMTAV